MSKATMDALNRIYMKGKICLFTGAGVSFTAAQEYRLEKPGWWGLLFEVYKEIHCEQKRKSWSDFEALNRKFQTAWDMASALADQAGDEKKLIRIMRQILIKHTGSDEKYKRLPMDYLDKANTLNAVIAFCSRLRAIRRNPCLVHNPRVRAVLTANYDWFLEGGATQKYNANPFKPMTTLKSREHPQKRLSVFHIHGYFPHNG